MMTSERQSRVAEAWAAAYRAIGDEVARFCAKHGAPPNCFEMIREYSPTMAADIDDAEKVAESASVEWANGGPGGVQIKIDAWVSLWLQGLETVSLAR